MHAIHIGEYGGPEVMTWTELPEPVPGPGEVLVRLGVAGVNFMDTGVRTKPVRGWSVPTVLGVEGMGYVTALGDGVRGLAAGDRVAWVYHQGSYAERLAIPADALVKVPEDVDDETTAAVMMQGVTANHFTTETYAVKPGDTAVVHAAAGGVGLMLTQMIKARGGVVIGLVSREEKVAVAKEAGADHVLVSYPTYADHVPTHEALVRRTTEIFDFVRKGQVKPRIGARYALADAAKAHADLESRRTTGKLLLLP